jgi:hypothetical protein
MHPYRIQLVLFSLQPPSPLQNLSQHHDTYPYQWIWYFQNIWTTIHITSHQFPLHVTNATAKPLLEGHPPVIHTLSSETVQEFSLRFIHTDYMYQHSVWNLLCSQHEKNHDKEYKLVLHDQSACLVSDSLVLLLGTATEESVLHWHQFHCWTSWMTWSKTQLCNSIPS